jgi:hypothetical protein
VTRLEVLEKGAGGTEGVVATLAGGEDGDALGVVNEKLSEEFETCGKRGSSRWKECELLLGHEAVELKTKMSPELAKKPEGDAYRPARAERVKFGKTKMTKTTHLLIPVLPHHPDNRHRRKRLLQAPHQHRRVAVSSHRNGLPLPFFLLHRRCESPPPSPSTRTVESGLRNEDDRGRLGLAQVEGFDESARVGELFVASRSV